MKKEKNKGLTLEGKKKTKDSPLRGDVRNSPSVSQKVSHWIEKTKLNTI